MGDLAGVTVAHIFTEAQIPVAVPSFVVVFCRNPGPRLIPSHDPWAHPHTTIRHFNQFRTLFFLVMRLVLALH
jgi:hypothetical protein